jgi:phenylacetate-CoA ligase
MASERKYWNMDVEPLLNTPEMREMQLPKLRAALRWQYENSPFNRTRFDKAGVKPEDIKSFEDFAEAIPPAGQAEVREVIAEVGLDMDKVLYHLFGEERMKNLYLLTTTAGTTGVPTPYPNFKAGIADFSEFTSRAAWRAGLRAGHRVALCFGLSMHAAGTPWILWLQDYPGITIIPIGAEAGTDKILQFMKMYKADIFLGTPSLALHLIEKAPEVLGEPVKSLGLEIIVCGAEPGAGIPEVRERLETEYGARVYDAGAGYGASCDYPIYQGMHWLADDFAYYELVDPETGKPVAMEHGATGLMCATSLHPEGAVWFDMRFSLGDIHQIFTEPCPCGGTGFRYKIVGRSDDMLKVKGVPVYPAAIEGVIQGFLPRVSGHFRIVLTEKPPRVVPPLKLKVERGEGVKDAELDALAGEISDAMHKLLKIRPEITWLRPGELTRETKKTQLLENQYEE